MRAGDRPDQASDTKINPSTFRCVGITSPYALTMGESMALPQ